MKSKSLLSNEGIVITNISLAGGDKWENLYGFSRAKVVENKVTLEKQVLISNTSAFDENGKIKIPGDPYSQVEQIINNMKKLLEIAGGNLSNIVETTFYTTSFDYFPEIAKAHKKYFGNTKPITTLLHVSEMASEDMLIEGSAKAIISNKSL